MKQKKQTIANRISPKSKEKPQRVVGWSEEDFSQLYPEKPQLHTSSTFFSVGLNYKGILLKVKLPTGIDNNYLPYIFHKEIYKYLLDMHDPNPLLKTAEIVGFQSMDSDILLDFQMCIGKGTLTRKTSFNCLEYIPEGKLKKYKICKCLAIGGFSKVYLVRSLRDGNFYAMKVMLKKFISSTQKENIIENEKNICSQLNHPFIVKLNHSFQTHNFVCFVLDYCPGGELFYYLKKVKRMSEQDAKFYFIQILYGLLYLHQQKIIYRDLKPENLLINHDGHIKIADFGLSKSNMKDKQLTYSFCGSTEYMPPEMILREGHSYGVDFYTLGALLYELVTGLPPFYSRDEQEIKEAIINEELSFPEHVELSNQIKNLLSGLLNKNQKLRIGSMKGLKEILFHPWIGRINSEAVLSKKLAPPYIPPINEFNFDENQLGDDEAQFTQALLAETLIPLSKEKLFYRDFQFKNQGHLRPEVQKILDKYKERKKDNFKKCTSLKNLKQRINGEERKSLKRQESSPYLRTQSLEKMKNSSRNHTSFSREKLIKNRDSSLTKSNSKKNLKNSYCMLMPQKLVNCTIRKSNKENSFNPNNPFLKKKKLVYNYMS